jgi:hypothetical protein
MKFLRVYTDTGAPRPMILYAKIVNENEKTYDIQYFSPMKKVNGQTIYNYETVLYTIDDESVVECLQGEDERVIGYQKTQDGWVRLDENDPDYEPSESECSSMESTSLEDELSEEEETEDENDDTVWEDDEDE